MKSVILSLILITTYTGISYAQQDTVITFIPVEQYPEGKMPGNATRMGFMTCNNGSFLWGYEDKETHYHSLQVLDHAMQYPISDDADAYYRNDTVVFEFRHAWRATVTTYYYKLQKKKLKYLSYGMTDHSWEMVDSAGLALKEGRIADAVDYYQAVQYPLAYINENEVAMSLLKRASELGLEALSRHDYQQACDYMEAAFRYYRAEYFIQSETEEELDERFDESYMTEQKDSFGLYMSHYGLFLYKSGQLERSVDFNSWVNFMYPLQAAAYLQKADALYDLGRTEEAIPQYRRYVELMQLKGNEKQIPLRVSERIKE